MMIGTTFDLLLLVHCAVRFTRLPAILLLDKTYPHTGVFRIAVAYRQIYIFWGDCLFAGGIGRYVFPDGRPFFRTADDVFVIIAFPDRPAAVSTCLVDFSGGI